jgi:hypothetical protein
MDTKVEEMVKEVQNIEGQIRELQWDIVQKKSEKHGVHRDLVVHCADNGLTHLLKVDMAEVRKEKNRERKAGLYVK